MSESGAETSEARGLYLYCLARPAGLMSWSETPETAMTGVDTHYPVSVIRDDARVAPAVALAAVVGEVVIDDFSEANLQSLAWLGERAARHEAVVAQVMMRSPVLPVKFGTIFRSRLSLDTFLSQHRADVVQALDRLQDKTEWSVKGYLAEDVARDYIAVADSDISSRTKALSTSPGARYLQQKQLDLKIETALQAVVAKITQDSLQALAACAVASVGLRLHASAVSGRPERMVINTSFLLTPQQMAIFQSTLAQQQALGAAMGLGLELRGPWPPYNFCPPLTSAAS